MQHTADWWRLVRNVCLFMGVGRVSLEVLCGVTERLLNQIHVSHHLFKADPWRPTGFNTHSITSLL